MSNQLKVDFLEAVTKDNDGLALGKEDQKEIQTVEREIFYRDDEENASSLEVGEKGKRFEEADIESRVESTNLRGLKDLKIFDSVEGGANDLLIEGKFCVEESRTGKDIFDFTEVRVMLQGKCFKLFKESVDKHEDNVSLIWQAVAAKGTKEGVI